MNAFTGLSDAQQKRTNDFAVLFALERWRRFPTLVVNHVSHEMGYRRAAP